jgi:preprotein translocase subunit SecD
VAADAETNLSADLLADPQDQTGQSFLRVLKPVVLDSSDVANASLTQDQPDQKTLLVHLTEPGSQKMASASAQGVGRRLAVVWNGRVLSAPYINSPIPGPDMNITGSFRNGEEQPLLDVLNHRHPSP